MVKKLMLAHLASDEVRLELIFAVLSESRLRREAVRRDGPYISPRHCSAETIVELEYPRRIEATLINCGGAPFKFEVDVPGAGSLEGTLVRMAASGLGWVATYEVE